MYYSVEKITNHIYQITGPESSNCQLIVGEDKALLFDTAYGFDNLRQAISDITDLPIYLVNSHGHLDHLNGNYHFPGVVYIHEADYKLALEHSSEEYRRHSVAEAKEKEDFITHQKKNILPTGFDEDAYIKAVLPTFAFVREGDCFELGGVTAKVMEFPGHTKGSIGLWIEEDRVLLAGDAFGPFTWLFAEEAGTLSEYRKTLRKASALNTDIILGGHETHPIDRRRMEAFLDVAENGVFEKGIPWHPPILEVKDGDDIRILTREGYAPFSFEQDGFASIVVSREKYLK